jgi:DNA-binding Xre family transcriptional regulator
MENTVYVDWEKVQLLIRELKIDLAEYGKSEVNYLSRTMKRPWSTIARIKEEKTTTLKTIGEMATALGCHPVDIISANGYPDPKSNAPVVHLTTEH